MPHITTEINPFVLADYTGYTVRDTVYGVGCARFAAQLYADGQPIGYGNGATVQGAMDSARADSVAACNGVADDARSEHMMLHGE